MFHTLDRHGIFAEEKCHKPRQENASANSSLISVLALATVAMVGLTLAAYFGACEVGSAGFIGCYVGTGVAGLVALIAAIASRCIEDSKPQEGLISDQSSFGAPQGRVKDRAVESKEPKDDVQLVAPPEPTVPVAAASGSTRGSQRQVSDPASSIHPLLPPRLPREPEGEAKPAAMPALPTEAPVEAKSALPLPRSSSSLPSSPSSTANPTITITMSSDREQELDLTRGSFDQFHFNRL